MIALMLLREFLRVKRQLWGGGMWEDGYFARTVGDKVTADVIRQHIRRHHEDPDSQLELF